MPTPYLPMVKAIAPNAAKGAAFITSATMPMTASPTVWTSSSTGLPRSPSRPTATPKRTASSSTGSSSPEVNAPTNVSGIAPSMNSVAVRCLAVAEKPWTAPASSFAGSAWMPSPGRTTLTTSIPSASATVVTASK